MSITDKLFVGFLGFLASYILVYFVINLIKTKKKTLANLEISRDSLETSKSGQSKIIGYNNGFITIFA